MEALLRLAYKIMNIWPIVEEASPIILQKRDSIDDPSISSEVSGGGGGGIQENIDNLNSFKEGLNGLSSSSSSSISSNNNNNNNLNKENSLNDLNKNNNNNINPPPLKAVSNNLLKSNNEQDNLNVASAHKSLRNICELLLMALRDRDVPGLRYLYQERKRKEIEHIAKLQRQQLQAQQQQPTTTTTSTNITDSSSQNVVSSSSKMMDIEKEVGVVETKEILQTPSSNQIVDQQRINEIEAENVRQLFASLELISGQAVHTQRTWNKSSSSTMVDHVTPRGKSSPTQSSDIAVLAAFNKDQDT